MRRIPVRGHFRTTPRGPIWISPSVRHIGDAEPETAAVWRDDRTGELFCEVETICAMAAMPDGAVIKGSLLRAARKEWR